MYLLLYFIIIPTYIIYVLCMLYYFNTDFRKIGKIIYLYKYEFLAWLCTAAVKSRFARYKKIAIKM